jgi:hypothetical protein
MNIGNSRTLWTYKAQMTPQEHGNKLTSSKALKDIAKT